MAANGLDVIKGFKKWTFFQEIFPHEFIEDGMIIRSDGNISVGFVLDFPEAESLSEDEIVAIQSAMEKVFSRLPIGTVVHFQSQYFFKEESIQAYMAAQTGFLITHMMRHLEDRPIMSSRTIMYLCFNLKNSKPKNPLSTIVSAFGLFKNPLASISKDKAIIKNNVQTFLTQFANVPKVGIRQLTEVGLKNEKSRYFNLDFGNNQPAETPDDFTSLGNKAVVGDKYVGWAYMAKSANPLKRTSLNERGVHTFMGWPFGFSLNFPHAVNLAFRIEGDDLLKAMDREQNSRKALGTSARQIDLLAMEDIALFTQEVRGEGKTVVLMNHNVMTWDTSSDQLSYNLDLIKAAYIRMNGSTGRLDSFNAFNFLFVYSPGYALDLFHTLRMTLEDTVMHFDYSKPVQSDQRGTLLCNRDQAPVLVDLWSDALVNKNRLCIGPSGSGKSFFWNTILSQAIEAGDEITILDVGGSYKNLFTLYEDSKYIETSHEKALSFNPFLVNTDERGNYLLTEDKITFLLALITILWKKTEKGESLSREEESIISEWLTQYYRKVNLDKSKPRLDGFVAFIEGLSNRDAESGDTRFFDVNSFSLVLKKFCRDGVYSKTLNSDDNFNISSNKLICFDLFGIQSDPILYPVVALIIMELVLDKVRKNPKVKKQIIIDEAWSMLGGSMGNFIEGSFRTLRKYNGGITIISQGIIELKNAPVGEAIKANAATRIILDHNSQPALIPAVQQFFGLTELETELLRSIRKGDTWREVFIQRGNVAQVFSVDVGEHAVAAFSSKAEDRAEISRLTQKAGPQYAINQFVENNSTLS